MKADPHPSIREFQKPGNSRAPLKQLASWDHRAEAVSMKTEAGSQFDRETGAAQETGGLRQT